MTFSTYLTYKLPPPFCWPPRRCPKLPSKKSLAVCVGDLRRPRAFGKHLALQRRPTPPLESQGGRDPPWPRGGIHGTGIWHPLGGKVYGFHVRYSPTVRFMDPMGEHFDEEVTFPETIKNGIFFNENWWFLGQNYHFWEGLLAGAMFRFFLGGSW